MKLVALFASFVLSILIGAIPTMLVWNAIIPDITNGALTTINFGQTLGLLFLCSVLFKSYSVNSK